MRTELFSVPTKGGNLFAKRWSPDSKLHPEPIVLLHDSLGSVGLWRDFPEGLAATTNRDLIAYDRLGFGESDVREEIPNERFIFEEGEKYFPDLKRGLSLDKYILFGHSVGGSMSINIAAHDSDCIALITESAQTYLSDRTKKGIEDAKLHFEKEGVNRLAKWHGDKATWVLNAWTEAWLSPLFSDWSLESIISDVHCPVLSIQGEDDEFCPPEFLEILSNESSGYSEVHMLENFGHVPHRENPEKILDLTLSFLKGRKLA